MRDLGICSSCEVLLSLARAGRGQIGKILAELSLPIGPTIVSTLDFAAATPAAWRQKSSHAICSIFQIRVFFTDFGLVEAVMFS
jgi:hypothetical protein